MDRIALPDRVVDFRREEVRGHNGARIELRPGAFSVLRRLAAADGALVTKDELLAECWPGVIVTEDSLTQCISEIRKALGEGGRDLIRTVPRRGYALVPPSEALRAAASEPQAQPPEPAPAPPLTDAPVTAAVTTAPARGDTVHGDRASPGADISVAAPSDSIEAGAMAGRAVGVCLGDGTAATPLSLPDKPSIAVLSFSNMTPNAEEEHFLDGMADDIITELSRDRSLFVIGRSSSFTYKGKPIDTKQIACDLGVQYVLEGSARRANEQVRVNVRLIEAARGTHLWAERYDRPVEAIFAVQDEITRAVVRAILPAVGNAERQRAMRRPPENLNAWEAWQRALWHWSGGDLSNSRSFLQQAVALDPRFAPPHALLSWLYLSESTLGTGPALHETIAPALAEAQTAVELDPESGFGHAMLAWVFDHLADHASALEEADNAIALSPNDPQGYLSKGKVLVYSGRAAEARDPLAVALRLDPCGPLAAVILHVRTVGSYFERDYVSAETTARRAIRTWPQYGRPFAWLPAVLGQMGRVAEAREALDKAFTVSSSYLAFSTRSRPPYFRQADHDHYLEGLRKAGWRG